jgi:polar amino acid transport system substrate-binding protein
MNVRNKQGTVGRVRRVGRIAAASLAGLLVTSLAACGGGAGTNSGSGSALDQIKKDGVVRVGFANEAPFAYSSPDGKLEGIMPASIEYVFSQIGKIKLEGVLTEFSGLIPGVGADRFDLVGAGLYINPDRCKQALPANPQYTAAEGMAVATGNPKNIASYDDLTKKHATFGTVTGSINLQYATKAGVAESDVVLFPDVPAALAGLKAGRVDAVGMSVISLQNVMNKTDQSGIELVKNFTPPAGANAYGAVYFAKGQEKLRDAYNKALADALKSGELLRIYKKLGYDERLLPPTDVTAADLCKG